MKIDNPQLESRLVDRIVEYDVHFQERKLETPPFVVKDSDFQELAEIVNEFDRYRSPVSLARSEPARNGRLFTISILRGDTSERTLDGFAKEVVAGSFLLGVPMFPMRLIGLSPQLKIDREKLEKASEIIRSVLGGDQ